MEFYSDIVTVAAPLTLRGSLSIRYFPSGNFMHVSMIQRNIPQALSMFRAICVANSFGRNCCVPRTVCLEESRMFTRDTYLLHTPQRNLRTTSDMQINLTNNGAMHSSLAMVRNPNLIQQPQLLQQG